MKINWAFVGTIVLVGFIFGFVKPFMNAGLHLAVSLVTYGMIWYFFRNKSSSADIESQAKMMRWTLLVAFIVACAGFLGQFNPPNVPMSILLDVFIIAGIAYCASLKVRLWVEGVIAKAKKSK